MLNHQLAGQGVGRCSSQPQSMSSNKHSELATDLNCFSCIPGPSFIISKIDGRTTLRGTPVFVELQQLKPSKCGIEPISLSPGHIPNRGVPKIRVTFLGWSL